LISKVAEILGQLLCKPLKTGKKYDPIGSKNQIRWTNFSQFGLEEKQQKDLRDFLREFQKVIRSHWTQ